MRRRAKSAVLWTLLGAMVAVGSTLVFQAWNERTKGAAAVDAVRKLEDDLYSGANRDRFAADLATAERACGERDRTRPNAMPATAVRRALGHYHDLLMRWPKKGSTTRWWGTDEQYAATHDADRAERFLRE